MANTIPSDMVAVFDKSQDGGNGRWWIYYITPEPELRILKGPVASQLEDKSPNYAGDRIAIEEIKPNPPPRPKAGNSQLGVIEWFDDATQKSQARPLHGSENSEADI